jgi:hypothetical protein
MTLHQLGREALTYKIMIQAKRVMVNAFTAYDGAIFSTVHTLVRSFKAAQTRGL